MTEDWNTAKPTEPNDFSFSPNRCLIEEAWSFPGAGNNQFCQHSSPEPAIPQEQVSRSEGHAGMAERLADIQTVFGVVDADKNGTLDRSEVDAASANPTFTANQREALQFSSTNFSILSQMATTRLPELTVSENSTSIDFNHWLSPAAKIANQYLRDIEPDHVISQKDLSTARTLLVEPEKLASAIASAKAKESDIAWTSSAIAAISLIGSIGISYVRSYVPMSGAAQIALALIAGNSARSAWNASENEGTSRLETQINKRLDLFSALE